MRRSIVAALTLAAAACGAEAGGPVVEITVPRGASFQAVVDTLAARELVGSPTVFAAYARIRGDDHRIRAGRYAFRAGASWGDLLDDLTAGRVLTEPMTIPEGFTLERMAPRIASIAELPADSVRRILEDDSLHHRYEVPGPGLEGYLFPDTYRFAPGTSLEQVLESMVDRYESYWTRARRVRADSLDLTEREIVTLASIIQAEARRGEEMPLISGVYHNRLRRGQLLQADPTVLYALGGPRERLLFAAIDSVADHPYNTYSQPGLPPGPIGAPGEAALDAALHPTETEYLFFVARPNGEHYFTRTLAEHNRAKARARREWDTARASVEEDAAGPGGGGLP